MACAFSQRACHSLPVLLSPLDHAPTHPPTSTPPFRYIQLGDLVPALKLRLSDSNKNLVIQALGLIAKLAKALSKGVDRACRVLLQPALKNLSDLKPMVGGSSDMGLNRFSPPPCDQVSFTRVETLSVLQARSILRPGRVNSLEQICRTLSFENPDSYEQIAHFVA